MELEKPVAGTEGGGLGSYLRIQSGPGQAAQQDPKSQPQQSLPPGPMPMGFQTTNRGGQPFFPRPQTRLTNSNARIPGVPPMTGAVFAPIPSGNMYPQPPQLVSSQGPPQIILQSYLQAAPRHHTPASGQAVSNQPQNFYQLPPQYISTQAMPPPYSNYGLYHHMPQARNQYNTPNSTQNQVPQQQPTPQQTALQSIYVDQVPGGGAQVTMPTMSGGPGGPNGTAHMMGPPQAPTMQTLVQNTGSIQPGAPMMQPPQIQKERRQRRHAIDIIDPNSGEKVQVDEEKDGLSHSADSSTSHTPQPQVSKDLDDLMAKQVTSEFAFKVAELAFADLAAHSATAPAPAPSAPPHGEDRLNGPVDHTHENEIVKEPSPAAAPQLTPMPTQPQPPPQMQQHTAPPAFVPIVSASTPSPLVELHRPLTNQMSAVAKHQPPPTTGPTLVVQQPVAHVAAPSASPVPPPSTSPAPQASPVQTPSPVPQSAPAPVQPAVQPSPPPQAPAPVRKTQQVMGPPPAESAPAPKKGAKKESGTAAVRGPPPSARPGSSSTPPPAATTTVVGPPPAIAAPKTSSFFEMTNFKNFTPSRTQAAAAPPAPAAAQAPAPAPTAAPAEEKTSTNGESESQVAKAIQRPKQKKGGKVKGVEKGGTEMDAFVEPAPTPVAPLPARDPPPREPTPPAEPIEQPVENSTAPVIEQLIQPEADRTESPVEDEEGKDIEAMVAAKNEENAKASAASTTAETNNNNNITNEPEKEEPEVVADVEVEEEQQETIETMTIERTPELETLVVVPVPSTSSGAGAQAQATIALKYSYKDGQWSPINLEGKKVYDRDFLMEIKDSDLAKKKPDFNIDVDIFKDRSFDYNTPSNHRKNLHGSASMGSRGENPSPYRSSGSSNQRGPMIKVNRDRGPPRGMGNSVSSSGSMRSGMGSSKGGYTSVNSPWMREPEPVLHRDPNGWKPTHRQPANAANLSEEEKELEKLRKKIRSILNKLTPQKFEKLSEKILSIPVDNELHLREMVDLVFEKAVDEPSFSQAYADLCCHLQMKASQSNGENGTVTFRKLLITKCQGGFEKNEKDELNITMRMKEIEECTDPEKKKELKLLLDEEERRIRRKSVGLVRFIGELYKLQMLTHRIMHGCITSLLEKVAEEPLECLCKLLTTVGKKLESETKKAADGGNEFDVYFAKMKKLAQKTPDSQVSSRIRFMLQDVIELRQKAWKPRRDENAPKTLEQIHKDAERDEALQMNNNNMYNTPMHQGPKGGRHPNEGRRNPRQQDGDGWQTSGSGKHRSNNSFTTNTTLEPSKLQVLHFKNGVEGGISLGGGYSQWKTGASTNRSSGPADSRSGLLSSNNSMASPNRFAPLETINSMGRKGKGVSGSTSLEKERSIGGMMRGDRDRDDMRRTGSGPSSRDNSRPRYGQPGQSPAGSLNARMDRDFSRSEQPSSRDNSQMDNRDAIEARVPPANDADLNEEVAKKNADTVFTEWCSNNDLKETMLSYNDWFVGRNNGCLFVRLVLEKVIDGKPHTCISFGELLVHIIRDKKTITSKDIVTEFKALIDLGDDMIVDIPLFWFNFGHIFAPLVCNEVVTFDDVKEALADRPTSDRAPVVVEIFKALIQKDKTHLWSSSNTTLNDFIPEEKIDETIKKHNLKFLAEPSEEWRIHRDNLVKILQADSPKTLDEAQAFLAKIENSVEKKAFIEIVTTAVIKASLKDDKLVAKQLTKFDKLIQKYVDTTEELELICLFAIKNFVFKNSLELSVVTESFKQLYEDNIISEEGFLKWKDDTSIEPKDSEGRLLVTNALNPFYVFLAEPDNEDDEEES